MRDSRLGRLILVTVLLSLALATPSRRVSAQGGRAGLVVAVDGEAPVHAACVDLPRPTMVGIDLLREAHSEVRTAVSPVGEAVCRIGEVGCDFPASDCFCRCTGAGCLYWSYWTLEPDGWAYAGRGGGSRVVGDGAVDAWVWGDGSKPPPAMTFADICGSDAQGGQGNTAAISALGLSVAPQQEPYPAPSVSATSAAYPGPEIEDTPSATRPAAPTLEATLPLASGTPAPISTSRAPTVATSATRLTPVPTASQRSTTAPLPVQSVTVHLTPEMAQAPADSPQPGTLATPSPDIVAERIRAGVTTARAEAATRAAQAQRESSGYGWFVVSCAVLVLLACYALLLRRQRAERARQAYRPAPPDSEAPEAGGSAGPTPGG